MNVLHVCANPKPAEESVSKQLSIAFISKLIEVNPDAEINNVDLYQDAPPFLSYEAWRGIWLAAMEPTHKLTKKEQEACAYANRHAEMFNQADLLVLTMPMWNFGPPAIMKAWLDMVLSPGRTFDLTLGDGGGLQVKPRHKLQRVVLLVSSGGVYTENDPRDGLTAMIRSAFAFIGVERIQVAWADGQTPLLYGDHEQRRQMAIDAATDLAEEIGEESLAAPTP